jgi:type II secretory pathway component GspD/PulD (secretin)
MKIKKYIPYLALIPTLGFGAELQLSFVGNLQCVNPQTKKLDAEYTLLKKINLENPYELEIDWVEITLPVTEENQKPQTIRLPIVKVKDLYSYVEETYSILQTHAGVCSPNDVINIKIDKPIDALTLLLAIAKAYNFQYQIDGDLIYVPSYVVIKKENISADQLVKFLIERITKFNPWLKIEFSWKNRLVTVTGDVYNIEQLQSKYGAVLLQYLSSKSSFTLGEGEQTKVLNPLCQTLNYVDLCKNGKCERFLLSIDDNKIDFVPYKECQPGKATELQINNTCPNRAPVVSLYLDNVNLVQLLKLFEKLFDIKFVYNEKDLNQIKYSQNLHLAFSCMDKKKALEFLNKNFHLYLEEIGHNIYRIFINKDDYFLVLREVSENVSKVFYLKGISPNDFAKYIELYYKGKVQYSIDPTFNAIILIGPKKVIEDISKRFAVYIRNANTFDNLMSKIFYVKYGDPEEIAKQIENYLSRRGVVKTLEDVNAIEVTDYPTNISMIEQVFKGFLSQQPVKIKVSVRFVKVQKSFLKELGVNWSIGWLENGKDIALASTAYHYPDGFAPGDYSVVSDYLMSFDNGTMKISPVFVYKKLNPIALKLQASEQIGLAKTISSPYLVLLNGKQGTLTQGIQIPYQAVDANGNPTTIFKEAVMRLDITPKLLPDGKILLTLNLSKDSPAPNAPTSNAGPPINTFKIEQNFIVPNGESIILGGVLDRTKIESTSGVPGLMRIPLLGWLFKVKNWNNQDDELIVIITAKVINQ